MKLNSYQLGAAAALAFLVVIAVFVQRSNWNRDRYILSADNAGNLISVSEAYFDSKEKALLAKVDAKLAQVDKNTRGIKENRDWLMDHTCHWGDHGGCATIATHFRGTRTS